MIYCNVTFFTVSRISQMDPPGSWGSRAGNKHVPGANGASCATLNLFLFIFFCILHYFSARIVARIGSCMRWLSKLSYPVVSREENRRRGLSKRIVNGSSELCPNGGGAQVVLLFLICYLHLLFVLLVALLFYRENGG